MVNGKRKGTETERIVSYELQQAIGNLFNIDFKRNPYDQAREKNHPDVVCSDPTWPFAIEVKRRKSGKFKQAWMDQAVKAAKYHQFPVVIYRFDREAFQVALRLGDLIQMYFGGERNEFGDLNTENVTIDLSTFYIIAREVFADVKRDPQRFAPSKCFHCDGSGEVEKTIEDPSGFPYEIDVMVPCDKCVGVGLC